MKIKQVDPPREFEVGFDTKGIIKDCAHIALEADEQITLTTARGAEYDVTRKSWGFYATPSVNGRLARFGLRAVLVKNRLARYFVLLVERGCEGDFNEYVASEPLQIVCWLDSSEALAALETGLPPTRNLS